MIGYRRKKKNKLKIFFIAIMLVGVIMGTAYYLYTSYEKIDISESRYKTERLEVSTQYGKTVESEQEKSKKVADVLEEVTKSVCGISKLKSKGNSALSVATETELGIGTGIVISSNGYILSNSHVTGEKYSTCYVTIEDENTYKGTVVWSDSDLDLSITKILATDLSFVSLGKSSDARVGETVYAIGNPIGREFRRTVTSGIISAVNRTIKLEENKNTIYMSDLIQTDATINPGNSGGPLIYPDGKVVGVNSVKITSAEGIGFAVPIDVVKPIIQSFMDTGKFEEATLGIYGYDNSVTTALNLENEVNIGVYVSQIIRGSSSDGSGLLPNDVITKIDGTEIKSINDLRQYIYSKVPGDTVTLEIMRKGKKREIEIELKKR